MISYQNGDPTSDERPLGWLIPDEPGLILFGEILGNYNRRRSRFLGSVCIHVAALGLLLVAAPKAFLNGGVLLHGSTTLIAPVEPAPFVPKKYILPRTEVAVVRTVATAQRALPPLPASVKPRIPHPMLEDAPSLATVSKPQPALSLPQEAPVISPPVQTGIFASNLNPKASSRLRVPSGQSTGFDVAVSRGSPELRQTATAGFDTASSHSQLALGRATVQTGAFGQATVGQQGPARVLGAKVDAAGFDTRPATQPLRSEPAVRKSGFDEVRPVNAPVQLASAASPIHALEILDKPKPDYTEEARRRKIEGDVLLDVIFTATGEVHVQRVVEGLGYGLDENAISAARRIRFTPASQSGSPIDQRVTIRVVFQITR